MKHYKLVLPFSIPDTEEARARIVEVWRNYLDDQDIDPWYSEDKKPEEFVGAILGAEAISNAQYEGLPVKFGTISVEEA